MSCKRIRTEKIVTSIESLPPSLLSKILWYSLSTNDIFLLPHSESPCYSSSPLPLISNSSFSFSNSETSSLLLSSSSSPSSISLLLRCVNKLWNGGIMRLLERKLRNIESLVIGSCVKNYIVDFYCWPSIFSNSFTKVIEDNIHCREGFINVPNHLWHFLSCFAFRNKTKLLIFEVKKEDIVCVQKVNVYDLYSGEQSEPLYLHLHNLRVVATVGNFLYFANAKGLQMIDIDTNQSYDIYCLERPNIETRHKVNMHVEPVAPQPDEQLDIALFEAYKEYRLANDGIEDEEMEVMRPGYMITDGRITMDFTGIGTIEENRLYAIANVSFKDNSDFHCNPGITLTFKCIFIYKLESDGKVKKETRIVRSVSAYADRNTHSAPLFFLVGNKITEVKDAYETESGTCTKLQTFILSDKIFGQEWYFSPFGSGTVVWSFRIQIVNILVENHLYTLPLLPSFLSFFDIITIKNNILLIAEKNDNNSNNDNSNNDNNNNNTEKDKIEGEKQFENRILIIYKWIKKNKSLRMIATKPLPPQSMFVKSKRFFT